MAQTSTKRRNIIITSIIIMVFVVSSIGALVLYQHLTKSSNPTKLSVNVSANQNEVLQGSSLQAKVNVTSIGKAENVTLSSVGSSGINCTFEPSTSMSNFTSTLTISVPKSTPAGNYSVIVTASGGGSTKNASYVISVLGANALSANVKVSGRVMVESYYPDVYLNSIQFQDLQTYENYTFTFPSDSYVNNYSITLQNEHSYNVTVNFHHGIGPALFPDTIYAGNLYVYAPVGKNMISGQDYNLNNFEEK